ncbi:MAG: hypothetical protein K2L87_00280, partial [Clostridiales bacterium]|nr:hypothetical protein [Clostridiales bacterium]
LALSELFVYFKAAAALTASGDKKARQITNQIKKTYSLLGLFQKDAEEYLNKYAAKSDIPAEVEAVAKERQAARAQKDWKKSDELREKLKEMGYAVKDSKDGYELTKL